MEEAEVPDDAQGTALAGKADNLAVQDNVLLDMADDASSAADEDIHGHEVEAVEDHEDVEALGPHLDGRLVQTDVAAC